MDASPSRGWGLGGQACSHAPCAPTRETGWCGRGKALLSRPQTREPEASPVHTFGPCACFSKVYQHWLL